VSTALVASELLESGDAEAAVALLEPLVAEHPDAVEYRTLLGAAYSVLEDYASALAQFNAVIALDPENDALYIPLGAFYASLGHLVLAARTVSRAASVIANLEPAISEEVQSILREANEAVCDLAAEKNVPLETVWDAVYWRENGIVQGYLLGELATAEDSLRKAITIMPNWPMPYNDLTMILFLDDRWQEAVAVLERVLHEVAPDDLDAVVNALRIYSSLGDAEQVARCRERLHSLERHFDLEDAGVLNRVVEGYAAAGDDQAVYRLLQQTTLPVDEWRHPEWLGTAAANLGRMTEALKHWQPLVEKQPANLATVFVCSVKEQWGWPPDNRFPYFTPYELLPIPVYEVLSGEFEEGEDDQLIEEQLPAWADRYPGIADAFALSLWHPDTPDDSREEIVDILASLWSSRAVKLLEAFATGKQGSDSARLWAADALVELGAIPAGSTLRMWIDGRWQDTAVGGDWEESDLAVYYPPEIEEKLEAASELCQAGRFDEARQIYRELLAQDPDMAEAYLGLAHVDVDQGRYAAALQLLQRTIEIAPDYGQAYLLTALAHLRREEWDEAIAALEQTAELWLPEELRVTQERAWAYVLARKGDRAGASLHLDRLAALLPEGDETVAVIRASLDALDALSEWRQRLQKQMERRHQKALTRPIVATDLASLLALHTKDNLVSIARTVGVSFRHPIRKAELIRLIAQKMPDADLIHEAVNSLSDEERTALRQVIQGGGQISYSEMVDMLGPEPADEATDWYYQEPTNAIGRLRVRGFLFAGTRGGQVVLVMADELRPLLAQAFGLS